MRGTSELVISDLAKEKQDKDHGAVFNDMTGNDISPLQRLINATRNSLSGLARAWKSEAALRYEIYVL